MISKSYKHFSDSYWSADTCGGFFFLCFRWSAGKICPNNGTKCAERKTDLMVDFFHAVIESREKVVLILFEGHVGRYVGADFLFYWCDIDGECFWSSQDVESNRWGIFPKYSTQIFRVLESKSVRRQDDICCFETCFFRWRTGERIYHDTWMLDDESRSQRFFSWIKNRDHLSSRAYLREECIRSQFTNMDGEWFCTSHKKYGKNASSKQKIHTNSRQQYDHLFPPECLWKCIWVETIRIGIIFTFETDKSS